MGIRTVQSRKLLVASIGVAAVSYVVSCGQQTSGNLMPAPPVDAPSDAPPTSGNLAPPFDAGSTDASQNG